MRSLMFFALVVGIAMNAFARTLVVDSSHPAANDSHVGSAESPLRTISAAAERAQPGDVILVQPGVYREHVVPARGGEAGKPIVYRAAVRGQVYVKGSDEFRPDWKPLDHATSDVVVGHFNADSFHNDFNPFHHGFRGYHNVVRPFDPGEAPQDNRPQRPNLRRELVRGMVFVDGQPLVQAITLDEVRAIPGSFHVPPEGGKVVVHFAPDPNGRGPADRLVEITARMRVFAPARRGLGHIHVDGFVFEHAANNHPTPQLGMVSTRSGHHWTIEHCTIRFAATIGLDVGSEWGIEQSPEQDPIEIERRYDGPGYRPGFHVIRNNVISDNGLGGMLGIRTWGTRIVNNVFARNNRLAFRTWEVGAIKMHFFFDGLIEANLIRDNDCFGIWLDNQYTGSRVTRNVVVNSHLAGVNVELGHGPVLVDNNVIAYTRAGSGIYSHDASGVTIAHNLIYANAHFGVYMAVATDRGEDSSRNRVLNNLILGNKGGAISLPFAWARARDNLSDHNLIMGGGETMDEGSGPEAPMFQANTSHKNVSIDTIAAALVKALDDAGVPADQRIGVDYFRLHPYLTIDHWRLLTGHDRRSKVFKLYHEFLGSRVIDFVFRPDATIWTFDLPTIAGIDRDFTGRPMPKERRLPGPFQDVRAFDTNRYILWPMRAEGTPHLPRPRPPRVDETATPDEKKDLSTPGF